MTELLLLGLIPGTQIQITFGTWLFSLAILVVLAGLQYLHMHTRPLLLASVYFSAWRAMRGRPTSQLA